MQQVNGVILATRIKQTEEGKAKEKQLMSLLVSFNKLVSELQVLSCKLYGVHLPDT